MTSHSVKILNCVQPISSTTSLLVFTYGLPSKPANSSSTIYWKGLCQIFRNAAKKSFNAKLKILKNRKIRAVSITLNSGHLGPFNL